MMKTVHGTGLAAGAVRPLVVVMVVLVVGLIGPVGCASTGVVHTEPPTTETVPTPPAAMLLADARAAAASGDYDRAASLVERAMRIDARNAGLYLELAGIRLSQGQPRQAEGVAMRAMALAPGNRAIATEAWGLIATARERRGDTAGAAAARDSAGKSTRPAP